jgi:hypothetical protein
MRISQACLRALLSLALAAFFAATLSAATDPFVGTWKLNPAKSKFTGEQLKIEDLGQNRYKISGGIDSDTLTADGSDQPIRYGRTESITKQAANVWKVVQKQDGKVLSAATWTLSADGKTLAVKGTDNKPDGTTSDYEVAVKRVGSGSGFAGTWETTDVKFTSPNEYVITSYQGDGLTFSTPAYKEVLNMKFDGKDYPSSGPNVPAGAVTSGRRVNASTLDTTGKIKDKVTDHTTFTVSTDGKTMTLTIHETGQAKALTAVYDKQ